jgi:predicted TIM-barrel fold metal-dependent hydrolase
MEPYDVYERHIGEARRDLALRIETDEAGWPWLTFKGRHLHFIDDHVPGRPSSLGARRRRFHDGAPPPPLSPARDHDVDPGARIALLDEVGTDAAIVFPNLGLLWEDCLREDVPALCANLEAYNTWLIERIPACADRLYPVCQLTLRDPDWFERELARCARAGVRLAMIGPNPVGGKSLAHPDLDRAWSVFVEHNVTVCFHVGQIQRPLDPAWYALDPEPLNKLLDNVFLYLAPAVAVTSMIVHGTLERHPRLRIGVVEQSARWVPEFLLHLDGGTAFYELQNGRALSALTLSPSEYFRRQIRVCALAMEGTAELMTAAGSDIFMWGSDYPHSEGMRVPSWQEYESMQSRVLGDDERAALAGRNAAFLLDL